MFKRIALLVALVVLVGGYAMATGLGNLDRLANEKGQLYMNGHDVNVTGASTLSGAHTGTSTGTNTGDETQTTIKTKLGAVNATADGYMTAAEYNNSVNTGKTNSTGYWLCTAANCSSTVQANFTNGLVQ